MLFENFFYPPANTLGDPVFTEVQPVMASPTLPQPFPLINTVELPLAIGAECGEQGLPPGIR